MSWSAAFLIARIGENVNDLKLVKWRQTICKLTSLQKSGPVARSITSLRFPRTVEQKRPSVSSTEDCRLKKVFEPFLANFHLLSLENRSQNSSGHYSGIPNRSCSSLLRKIACASSFHFFYLFLSIRFLGISLQEIHSWCTGQTRNMRRGNALWIPENSL